MDQVEQINRFQDDLDSLIERYRAEYDITYAGVIGAMQIKIILLVQENQDPDD